MHTESHHINANDPCHQWSWSWSVLTLIVIVVLTKAVDNIAAADAPALGRCQWCLQ